MSAFQLPETHIGAIARFASDSHADLRVYWSGSTRTYDFEDLCRILAAECYRSVRARYPTGPLPGPTSAPDGPVVCGLDMHVYARLEPVDCLKACRSYAYQTCETGDYPETEAYAIISAIEAQAVRELPGFDASPAWEIDYTAAEQRTVEAEARSAHHQAARRHAEYINSQN